MNILKSNAKEATSSLVGGKHRASFDSCRSCVLLHSSQSTEIPTSSEQLAIDGEMDGMALGEEKAEEKRLKDEKWARFTDENPRGQGNTMNRG
jgi:hypothetical protein